MKFFQLIQKIVSESWFLMILELWKLTAGYLSADYLWVEWVPVLTTFILVA